MKKLLLIGLLCANFQFSWSQNTIKHKVVKGETVTQIAKKYSVTPNDIYKLNPDAVKGVSENTILIISAPKKVTTVAVKTTKHEVKAKETWYSLSKFYGITIEEIQAANPEVKNGLSIGQILNIPVKKGWVKPQLPTKQEAVLHTVQAKETKYGITKQYGITIEELEKKNPEIIGKELSIGQVLVIKGIKQKETTTPVIPSTPKVETPIIKEPNTVDYIVKPQETIYGIAKDNGLTPEELIVLNPVLKDGLQEGMTIKVPKTKLVKFDLKKEYTDLTKSLVTNNKKKLALLLPFNITKLDQDTINSTKSRLKKDKFLNMTLDFYSGALVAIDSAKTLGLNVDIAIVDSDETKSTSAINSIVDSYNLKNYDAVIGPFYQNNIEKLAQLIPNVPIISPLSKDYDKKYPNLIQATPLPDDVRNAMFDFMKLKSGNIIAVIDPKKASVKQYIETQQIASGVQFVNFNEHGNLDTAHLKSLLVKDKMNYVILETEKTNMILSTTGALLNTLKEYQVNLVLLGENDAFDYEEIQMSRLTKLKMQYPSAIRQNNSDEATIFENSYKKKNRVLPNAYATRGFDVTFDALLRLQQNQTLLETYNNVATQQVEGAFNFVPNPDGGFMNKGAYILFYDTDLTIKQAN